MNSHHTPSPGLSPGTLLHVGKQKTNEVTITLLDYDGKGYFMERETADLAELAKAIQTPTCPNCTGAWAILSSGSPSFSPASVSFSTSSAKGGGK